MSANASPRSEKSEMKSGKKRKSVMKMSPEGKTSRAGNPETFEKKNSSVTRNLEASTPQSPEKFEKKNPDATSSKSDISNQQRSCKSNAKDSLTSSSMVSLNSDQKGFSTLGKSLMSDCKESELSSFPGKKELVFTSFWSPEKKAFIKIDSKSHALDKKSLPLSSSSRPAFSFTKSTSNRKEFLLKSSKTKATKGSPSGVETDETEKLTAKDKAKRSVKAKQRRDPKGESRKSEKQKKTSKRQSRAESRKQKPASKRATKCDEKRAEKVSSKSEQKTSEKDSPKADIPNATKVKTTALISAATRSVSDTCSSSSQASSPAVTPGKSPAVTPGRSPGRSRNLTDVTPNDVVEVAVTISKKESELLGVMIDDELIIAGVKPNSPAAGQLVVGDRVLTVDGAKVKDADHFSELVVPAYPQVVIMVLREVKPQHSIILNVPQERAKLCPFRNGFSYQVVRIERKGETTKLGLTIKDCPNGVFVSRVEPNSAAAGLLQAGDRLVDVDSKPISNREDFRINMLRSLEIGEYFTSLVERAESSEAKQEVRAAMVGIFDCNYAPSVKLGTDVREIAARQRRKLSMNVQPQKAMVKKTDDTEKRVKIVDVQPDVFVIGSDTEGKTLRHVRKE